MKKLFTKIFKNGTVPETQLDMQNIPAHIAIIMDGNGRWAKKRHMPRVAGHKQGMETVKTITKAASDLGVKVLTSMLFQRKTGNGPKEKLST